MDAAIKKTLWNSAGTAGLLLGLVSTLCMYGGQFLSTKDLSPILTGLTGMILWVIETGGCIYLMYFFMQRFSQACPSAGQRESFRMGMATALLSALIYSAAIFANMAYISADLYNEEYKALMQQVAPLIDSNSTTMMEKMLNDMPQISFFTNLVYCFLFGTLVSAVLSRTISSKDPFADYKTDEQ